jgi:hypothetical protein
MLGDLEQNVDRADSKLASAMRRMKKFIRDTEGPFYPLASRSSLPPDGTHADTKSGWCIAILIVILLILLVAVILIWGLGLFSGRTLGFLLHTVWIW